MNTGTLKLLYIVIRLLIFTGTSKRSRNKCLTKEINHAYSKEKSMGRNTGISKLNNRIDLKTIQNESGYKNESRGTGRYCNIEKGVCVMNRTGTFHKNDYRYLLNNMIPVPTVSTPEFQRCQF